MENILDSAKENQIAKIHVLQQARNLKTMSLVVIGVLSLEGLALAEVPASVLTVTEKYQPIVALIK